MLTAEVGKRFHHIIKFDSTKLHERPGIQSQAAAAVVTKDADMDFSLRDWLVRMCIPNNVEREGFQQSR